MISTPEENRRGFLGNKCYQCGQARDPLCKIPGCKYKPLVVDKPGGNEPLRANELGRRHRKYSCVKKQEGPYIVTNETFIPLTPEEVAAIHLGRVRLANNSAIKEQTAADGSKSYVPIDDNDKSAHVTCGAINMIDKLLEGYDYKFGAHSIDLLTA